MFLYLMSHTFAASLIDTETWWIKRWQWLTFWSEFWGCESFPTYSELHRDTRLWGRLEQNSASRGSL